MSAAFGRLCVETIFSDLMAAIEKIQPPSGGCVLKHKVLNHAEQVMMTQPPSGGCVLKQLLHMVAQGCSISRLRAAVC